MEEEMACMKCLTSLIAERGTRIELKINRRNINEIKSLFDNDI